MSHAHTLHLTVWYIIHFKNAVGIIITLSLWIFEKQIVHFVKFWTVSANMVTLFAIQFRSCDDFFGKLAAVLFAISCIWQIAQYPPKEIICSELGGN